MSPEQISRFMNKIQKTNNCWIWQGATNDVGYGYFSLNGTTFTAHKISYELFKEEIIKGLQIDHLCRNRKCVNPQHLEVVTQQENIRRGESGNHGNHSKGESHYNSKKTHCIRGHEYTTKNTLVMKNGRTCRACIKIRKDIRNKRLQNA